MNPTDFTVGAPDFSSTMHDRSKFLLMQNFSSGQDASTTNDWMQKLLFNTDASIFYDKRKTEITHQKLKLNYFKNFT